MWTRRAKAPLPVKAQKPIRARTPVPRSRKVLGSSMINGLNLHEAAVSSGDVAGIAKTAVADAAVRV